MLIAGPEVASFLQHRDDVSAQDHLFEERIDLGDEQEVGDRRRLATP